MNSQVVCVQETDPIQESLSLSSKSSPVVRLRRSFDDLLLLKSLNPGNLVIGMELASLYEAQGDIEASLDELRLLWLENQNHAPLCYEIARLYSQKDQEKAFLFFEKTLQIQPNHREALRDYSRLLVTTDLGDKVFSVLDRWRYQSPADPEPHYLLAVYSFRLGRVGKGLDFLLQAIHLDPDNVLYLKKLAELYLSQGQNELVLSTLAKVEISSGLDSQTLEMRIKAFIGLDLIKEAEDLLSLHLSMFSDVQAMELNLEILEKQEDMTRFWECLEKNLKTWPNEANLQKFYKACMQAKEHERLISLLLELKSTLQKEPFYFLAISSVYREDRPQEALEWILQGLSRYPQNIDLLLEQGKLLVILNRQTQAMKIFQKLDQGTGATHYQDLLSDFIEDQRKNRKVFTLAAKLDSFLEKKMFSRALSVARELVQCAPESPEWQEQLGDLAAVETHYPMAREAYLQAAEGQNTSGLKKLLWLSWVHCDFETCTEVFENMKIDSDKDFPSLQFLLKVHRHLLAQRANPLSFYETILLNTQKEALSTKNPVKMLENGFCHLYLGSHLLDANLWYTTAREMFCEIISSVNLAPWHSYAYEGLYLVYLMNYEQEPLFDLLKWWVKVDSRPLVRELLLEEFFRQKRFEEALTWILEEYKEKAPPLDIYVWRQRFEAMAWFEKDGRLERMKAYLARLQDACSRDSKNPGVWLALAFASLEFSAQKPAQEWHKRAMFAMQKALALQDHPYLHARMLEVHDYALKIPGARATVVYGARRLYLEQSMQKNPENPRLLYESGRLGIEEGFEIHLAARSLIKALTMDPGLHMANYWLGNYWLLKNESKKAYHYYLKTIEHPVSMKVWLDVVEKMQRIV